MSTRDCSWAESPPAWSFAFSFSEKAWKLDDGSDRQNRGNGAVGRDKAAHRLLDG